MADFLNKPEKGTKRQLVLDQMEMIVNVPYIDILRQESSKRDLTVSEINSIINSHMMALINEFNLEYSDFKPFMLLWEEEMKTEEKLRREMWD